MSALRVAGAGLAAAGAGLLLTMWWKTVQDPPGTRDVGEREEQGASGTAADDCPELDTTEEQLAAIDLRTAAVRARIGTLEQERTDIAGEPVPWADDAAVSPDKLEERAIGAADEAGLTLQEIDCSEDPCVFVASFHIPEDAPFGDVQDHHAGGFKDALADLRLRYSSSLRTGPDGGMIYTVYGSLDAGESRADDTRTRFRQDALNTLVEQEIRDGDRQDVPAGVWPPEDEGDSVDPAPGGD